MSHPDADEFTHLVEQAVQRLALRHEPDGASMPFLYALQGEETAAEWIWLSAAGGVVCLWVPLGRCWHPEAIEQYIDFNSDLDGVAHFFCSRELEDGSVVVSATIKLLVPEPLQRVSVVQALIQAASDQLMQLRRELLELEDEMQSAADSDLEGE